MQGGEPTILPIGVVVTDQHGQTTELGIEHREAEIAAGDPALILRVEPVLAIFANVAVGTDERGSVVAKTARGIEFGNADHDIHVIGARHFLDRSGCFARNRVEMRLHHCEIIKDVADRRLLRQHREAHALLGHVFNPGNHAGDVAIEIAPRRIERDRGRLETHRLCGRAGLRQNWLHCHHQQESDQ